MATHTTYYNLTKPAQNDKVNVGVLNDNADKIDTALHNKVDSDDLTANNVMLSDGVTSVEDALDEVEEKIGNMRAMKLWENPNPSVDFEPQSITLSSADYDFLLTIYASNTSGIYTMSNISKKGSGIALYYVSTYTYLRVATRTSDTQYAFDNSVVGTTAYNNTIIPLAIYGIKLT